jgi:hypothetical protein
MTPSTTPNQTSPNVLLKWALILATAGFSFVCIVELINILFYDPYEEERFLFSFAESLMETEIEQLTLLMFGSLALLLMAGLPMAFVVGGLGVVFIYLVGGQTMVNIIPTRIYPLMSNADLAAIPLFIFMASMLEKAGLIEEMFDVVYKWMGGTERWISRSDYFGIDNSSCYGWRHWGCCGHDGHHRSTCYVET